jgi:3-oxosteroid 1-dehydrogenase
MSPIVDNAAAGAWDSEVDLLVVGSGAAGLTGAVVAASGGAKVLVIEKSALIGGTSATSGGGVWIPCSPAAAALGHEDSVEAACGYLRQLTDDHVTDARIDAFVRGAPAMLAWLAQHTSLHFNSMPYPDYHQDLAGAKAGWRTHFPRELHGRALGAAVNLIREESPVASLFGKINWTVAETQALLHRPPGWLGKATKMLLRYALDIPQRVHSSRDRFLSLGNAIVGHLLLALQQRAVPLQRNTRLLELVVENSRIEGAVVEQLLDDGSRRNVRIRTRRGVLLASGGFERNAEMRARYLPMQAADPGMSGSQINNTGDAIAIAQRIGAATLGMDSAWWAPVFKVPGEERGRLCAVERALPGSIMVDSAGRRFMNEAKSYHVAAQAMLAADRPDVRTIPAYILFDARFQRRYPMGPLMPWPLCLQSRAVRATVARAPTWEQMAWKLGLPADVLQQTIERFNADARRGSDTEFGRGFDEYERYYGDPKVGPNPTLAPLEQAPFYAMQLHLGDIGTNGGLATDEQGRVLGSAGEVIAGLYAAGNTTASVMGHSYPGAGSTLGPAMTFAFLGMRHLLGEPTH